MGKPAPASGAAWRTLLVASLLAAPLGVAGAADIADLVVPAGVTRVVEAPLFASDVVVLGTLLVADGSAIDAASLRVGPQGVLEALPGADGADARGLDATGAPGEDGGSVVVRVGALVVEAGGRIVGGAGGRGGGADGRGVITGGDGGDGGSVVLSAATSRILGHVLPGSGGAGGNALQLVDGAVLDEDAKAVGGAGGDTGRVLLDGEPLPVDPASAFPSPNAVSEPLSSSGFSVMAAFPAYVPKCNDFIDGANAVGAAGTPSTVLLSAGAGGNACMVVLGEAGAQGGACQPGGAATSAKAIAIAGRGGDGFVIGADGGTGGRAWAAAKAGAGGPGGHCGSGAGGAGTGGGGASATAIGGDGGMAGDHPFGALEGIGGVGGTGGNAYSEAQAGPGGDGGDGTSAGGGGGGGGVAASKATGGNGGRGGMGRAPGGDGGDAFAYGASGKGGKGGNGNVKGGNGGDAGKLTQITVKGGQGGTGAGGGDGGDVTASVDPEGGDGGYPDGVGGDGGYWIVVLIGGNGGTGCNGESGGAPGTVYYTVPAGTGNPGAGPGGAGTPGGQLFTEPGTIFGGLPGDTDGPECTSSNVAPCNFLCGVVGEGPVVGAVDDLLFPNWEYGAGDPTENYAGVDYDDPGGHLYLDQRLVGATRSVPGPTAFQDTSFGGPGLDGGHQAILQTEVHAVVGVWEDANGDDVIGDWTEDSEGWDNCPDVFDCGTVEDPNHYDEGSSGGEFIPVCGTDATDAAPGLGSYYATLTPSAGWIGVYLVTDRDDAATGSDPLVGDDDHDGAAAPFDPYDDTVLDLLGLDENGDPGPKRLNLYHGETTPIVLHMVCDGTGRYFSYERLIFAVPNLTYDITLTGTVTADIGWGTETRSDTDVYARIL